jgi:hypothetical protein
MCFTQLGLGKPSPCSCKLLWPSALWSSDAGRWKGTRQAPFWLSSVPETAVACRLDRWLGRRSALGAFCRASG